MMDTLSLAYLTCCRINAVMNIVLISVGERVKEIGLYRAVNARKMEVLI